MKPIVPCVLATLLLASTSFAQDSASLLRDEVRDLRQEVRDLRQEVSILRRTVERLQNQAPAEPARDARSWGCYLQDVRAGGVYGTGRTEAEARGRALEQCSQKRGACFENALKCSRD